MQSLGSRAAWIALATSWATVGAQARAVHKCTVNGQVVYQAQSCPSGDTVLQIAPMPSDQERRQASTDLSRQRLQAATGRLVRPVYVPPPPPPPPPPPVFIPATTTSTTVILSPSSGRSTVIVQQTTRTAPQIAYRPSPNEKPLNNCEKLNRDHGDLVDRRDQLQAPGELASRQQMLDNAQAALAHVQDMAKASNCTLAR